MVANLNLPAPAAVGDEWGNQLNAAVQAVNAEVEGYKAPVLTISGTTGRLSAGGTRSGTDYNTLTEAGWYVIDQGVNAPGSGTQYVEVRSNGASYVSQVSRRLADGVTFVRDKRANTWGAWTQVLDTVSDLDARYPVDTTGRLAATPTSLNSPDYTTVTNSGWDLVNGGTNAPPTGGSKYLEVRSGGVSYTAQIARTLGDGVTYRRDKRAGTWSAWEAVPDTTAEMDARYAPASWTAWNSPAIGGANTMGNATSSGEYEVVGKRVDFWGTITLGSTTAISASPIILTLPVSTARIIAVEVLATDTGSTYYSMSARLFNSTNLAVYVRGANGGVANVTSASPFTWAAGDIITYSGTLKAA